MSKLGASSQFIIPDGYSPPFAIVSDTDHTAWIIIATALGLALVLQFGAIRVVVRGSICPGIGLDDFFLAAATVFAVVQASVILAATADGLGRSINLLLPKSRDKVQQLYYASILLFVIALGLSKLSVVFFLLRLTSYKTHQRIFYAVAAFIIAWTVGSFFALALQCRLSHPWLIVGQHCSGVDLRWQIICALDIAIEVSMVLMSVLLVWGLHARPWKKAAVVITFTFRLLMIIPIVFRLATFDSSARNSDFFLAEDLFIVWTQTELNYSIISATIPTLRIFATTLNTQFGGLTAVERASYSDSGGKNSSRDHDQSIGSQEVTGASGDSGGPRKENATPSALKSERQDRHGYNVASLKHFGESEERRRFSLQRDRTKKEKEKVAEASPLRQSVSIADGSIHDMTIRRDITYSIEHH